MSARERIKLLQMAKELDDMDRDLPSGEAAFLDKVIKTLGDHGSLTAKETKQLEALHKKYLSEEDEKEDDQDAPPFDRGAEGSAGDDDVDPDDFV